MLICESQRLIIRELEESDASFILELMNTEDWIRFIGDRNIRDIEDAKQHIREKHIHNYRKEGYGFWGVVEKTSNQLTGICGLAKREADLPVDIGFGFLPQFYNKGYGYESSVVVLEYAHATLGLDEIIGITQELNIASRALLGKLGMQLAYKKTFKEAWGESWVYCFTESGPGSKANPESESKFKSKSHSETLP